MTDIQIENQASVDQLPTSSPSFDDDEIYMDDNSGDEVMKPTQESLRSEKTMSIEEEEAQEAQPKNSPLPLDKNELTPNTTCTSKSVADAPVIIDLTDYAEEKNDDEKTKEEADDEKANEKMTEASQTSSEPKKANGADPKPKRKSKRASSTKSANSSKSGNNKTRKSKVKAQKSEEETGSQEKSPKKKLSKKKSVKKVVASSPIESTDEPSKPVPKTTNSSPADKEREVPPKSAQASPSVPGTPTKQPKNVGKSSPTKKQEASPKKVASPNDFQKRKEAKAKRADELRDYLGTVGDTLMVEPRSDDSVSYLTVPQVLQQADVDHHHGDLNKLPSSQVPPRTVNPMISMGDDGNCEQAERRISYDLEALMSHQVPPKSRSSKWENVSVITDEVETVLGEDDNADVVRVQSHGIKLGNANRDMGLTDIDLEQPSKEAATAVDCKTTSTTTFVSILEDLQNLMIRRPISASVIFVFLVATLVFLGIMLMQ